MIKNKAYFLFIKKIISSCLLIMATAYCYGQTAVLTGTVNNEKGEALASVSVVAKQGSIIKVYDNTNNAGVFKLALLAKQAYTIELSIVGYNKLIFNFNAGQETEQKTFTLQQKFTQEDTVKIITKRGVYERGDTIFYNTDFYKRNNENNLKDLLKIMPGVKLLSNGKIFVEDKMVDKLLIDGKDLTGENYEKIVNNLSPHNIDQIQVLKKYKDPYELSNSATGKTEVAINLTFKNKRIIPSAKLSASIGVPIKYYEYKTDFLVLTKPITAINFVNINSIGNTAQLIASPNSLFGNINTSEQFKKLGKGLPYQNNVNELFLKITKNYYSFNNTQYFDNSSQFNIGKKITDKFTFNYTPEKIAQTETGYSQTFIGNQVFAETNSLSNPIISRKTFSVKNELIYMLHNQEQIKWNASYLIEKETSVNNNVLNSINVLFNTNNKKIFANSLVNYTKFLKKETVINVAGFYEWQKNNELLNNSGVVYNNTIFSNSLGFTKSLEQNITTTESNIGAYVKLIKRKKDYSFTFQPTLKKVFGSLQSNLSALSTSNTLYNSIDSFKNNYNYEQTSISVPLMYKLDKYNFFLNTALEPIVFNSQIHNISSKIVNYNASFTIRYDFKNRRNIYIGASRNNDFSFLTKLFAANTIVGNKNKITATNFLLKTQSYSLNIGSNKYGSYSNKLNFGYRISGNLNTPNHLLNNTNNNFYAVQNYFSYLATNKGISGGISNNFTLNKLKTRFENDLNLSSRQSVSSQNNIIVASVSNSYQLDTKVSSKLEGMFNFQLNNTLAYSTNKRKGFNGFNKTLTDVLGLDINLNYMKKSHIDIEAKNYYFNTYNGSVQNIFLVNLSYKQLLNNNKLRLSLELRNITNRKAFVSQYLSVTQFAETQVALLPFFALLKLEFLL
jgi:hypothetical protein